jgi:SAM-dependent methyltransferase
MDSDVRIVRHWNAVADGWTSSGYRNPILARHKRNVYLRLLSRWTGTAPGRALKTDLFAEALNEEEFVSSLPWKSSIVGIDISGSIVARARKQTCGQGTESAGWATCDVRSLPFAASTFDFVLSDSTLDHLATGEEIEGALAELARVLSPGGTLVLTIDNPHAATYPPRWLVRFWMRLGLAPYYIGTTLDRTQLRDVLQRLGLRLDEETAILHYPHPDGMVRAAETALRALGRGRLDRAVEGMFAQMERLEKTRMRYVTGRYLAVRATKEGGR